MRKKTTSQTVAASPERLQKVMASAGLGSRRALEKQIAAGQVLLNGKTAEVGTNVAAGDMLVFEQQQWRVVNRPVQQRCLIYNKPEGEVTSRSDPDGRPTVFDRLPTVRNSRWIAVGRLDINTTGLLLLTTDGELAHKMMHPSSNVDREYACRIRGAVEPVHLENLRKGVELSDGPASFSDIQEAGGSGENHWFHVTIMEGRNREVRRLWESQGLLVSRLKRVRYGAAFLPKRLKMGQWSEITAREQEILREDVGLPTHASGLSLQYVKGPKRQSKQKKTRVASTPGRNKKPGASPRPRALEKNRRSKGSGHRRPHNK